MKAVDDLGGSPALDGWHYQCDVSVFVALDLLVVNRVALVLQLEPASQEDLEAELEAPRGASSAVVDGERLIVQAKLRRTGQWTAGSLRSLVEHGKNRPSALRLLEDKNARYVLFTSADLTGKLRALQVDALLERPSNDDLPKEVFPDPHQRAAAGRFAVLAQYNAARVVEKIDSYLLSPLGIPRERHEGCREELRKAAMERMRKGLVWHRHEVETVIKKHGGAIPSERDRGFVPPTNWNEIVAQMDKRNAIVITGPSGTGKTTLAKALYRHYRRTMPGISYVEPQRPGELTVRPDAGPTFFYVEDPWGKYEIGAKTTDWTAELRERLLKASAQMKIVVTSRTDILAAAVGSQSDSIKPWELRLEAKHYGEKELRKMFERRVRLLGSHTLKVAATRAERRVLQTLRTPFEIDRFMALLQVGATPADGSESEFVSRILDATQTDAIESEVESMVKGRDFGKAAVVLWGLMSARSGVRRQDLPTIQRAMNKLDSAFGHRLERLVNDMVAAGHLRQPGSDVTYTHPRVERGLLRVVRADRTMTELALENLLTALVGLGGAGNHQAIETALRLHAFIKNSRDAQSFVYEVPREANLAFDGWLEEELSADHDDYVNLLRLACTAGSSDCVPAEVARWLLPETGRKIGMLGWSPPQRKEEWYRKVRGHPLTQYVCERFIRLVLTADTRNYSYRVVEDLDAIAPRLDGAWVQAAKMIVDQSETSNAHTVGFGAMRAVENRLPLLELAVANLRKEDKKHGTSPDSWSYIDGHFNDDWDSYDDQPDHHAAARGLVFAYVEATRRDFGWRVLLESEDLDVIAPEWFENLESTNGEDADDDELRHLLAVGAGPELELRIWRLLERCWRPSFLHDLRMKLRAGDEHARLREAAAWCAMLHAPALLAEVAMELIDEGQVLRLLELVHDVKTEAMRWDEVARLQSYGAFEIGLPAPFNELAAAFAPLDEVQEVRLSNAALSELTPLLGKHKGPLRLLLIWLAATNGRASQATLEEALRESVHADEAELAVRAAAVAGCWRIVRSALTHPRAKARARALALLSAESDQRGTGDVAPMTSDPSVFVRRALLEWFTKEPERYAAALVQLCKDTWSYNSLPDGEDQHYPLAQDAARVLATLQSVPSGLTVAIVAATLETDDRAVADVLLDFLVERGGEDALREVTNIVFRRRPNWASVQAASAIARAERKLPADAFMRATQLWLSKSNSYLVTRAVEALGRVADSTQILATADTLTSNPSRRVLLIPLALGAHRQSADLADQVLGKLPGDHPATQIFVPPKAPLHHDALDQLGDVRTVEAVRWVLGDRIAVPPPLLEQ